MYAHEDAAKACPAGTRDGDCAPEPPQAAAPETGDWPATGWNAARVLPAHRPAGHSKCRVPNDFGNLKTFLD